MDWDRLNHVQPLLCWYRYMQMRGRCKVSLLLFQLWARQDGDSVILGESQGSQGFTCGGTHESPSQQLSHENQVEHVWTINSQMLIVLMLEARKVLLDAESDLVDDGDAGDDERRRSTMMGGDGWWWWCWGWHSCLVVLDARLDAFGGWKPRCRTFSDWFTSLVQTGAVGIGCWFGMQVPQNWAKAIGSGFDPCGPMHRMLRGVDLRWFKNIWAPVMVDIWYRYKKWC